MAQRTSAGARPALARHRPTMPASIAATVRTRRTAIPGLRRRRSPATPETSASWYGDGLCRATARSGRRLGTQITPECLIAKRPHSTRKAEHRVAAGDSFDGETRTRTGDTTIFRESQGGVVAHERAANHGAWSRATPARCCWVRVVRRAFGTPRAHRSPNGPRLLAPALDRPAT
jgi:hypothetical protein